MGKNEIKENIENIKRILDIKTVDDNVQNQIKDNINFISGFNSKYERNRIIFGAPGTGKSYNLNKQAEKLVSDYSGYIERVTFYPDYSYSQFVGVYKPYSDENEDIHYRFVPGPFIRTLVKAIKNCMQLNPCPFVLIIEEINRARAATVFGDIFQLLDRAENGVSQYSIDTSEDIRRFLANELKCEKNKINKIKIPDNMFIWATMNSADQGVFPIDTAFKRRWNFEYIGIDDGEKNMTNGTIELNTKDGVKELIDWNILRKAINVRLTSFKINEDKLLGPFFLSKKVTEPDDSGMIKNREDFIKAFKSKIIMYLYEDVAKQYKYKLFSGCDSSRYSFVCEAFDEIGIDIFGDVFREIYNQQKRR